jgi:PIN domain nuclease of toxin-antitoxin system
VILLDTNALIWLDTRHRRARPLTAHPEPLVISPATVLELQFLAESGRLRLPRSGVEAILQDDRWTVDDPPAAAWFARAAEESWTRDPFDRLIVAHARLRRCRIATGDTAILDRLRPSERFTL